MSFVKGIFGAKKTRARDDYLGVEGAGRHPEVNGSPRIGASRSSPRPGGGVSGAASRQTPRRHATPTQSPVSPKQSPGYEGKPTQEEIDAMGLPFKEKSSNKRDKSFSISRSGRHKYKNKQRMSVLQQDIYSDIPADQHFAASPSTSSANHNPVSGGSSAQSKPGGASYRGTEAHARQYRAPTLSISGTSAAV